MSAEDSKKVDGKVEYLDLGLPSNSNSNVNYSSDSGSPRSPRSPESNNKLNKFIIKKLRSNSISSSGPNSRSNSGISIENDLEPNLDIQKLRSNSGFSLDSNSRSSSGISLDSNLEFSEEDLRELEEILKSSDDESPSKEASVAVPVLKKASIAIAVPVPVLQEASFSILDNFRVPSQAEMISDSKIRRKRTASADELEEIEAFIIERLAIRARLLDLSSILKNYKDKIEQKYKCFYFFNERLELDDETWGRLVKEKTEQFIKWNEKCDAESLWTTLEDKNVICSILIYFNIDLFSTIMDIQTTKCFIDLHSGLDPSSEEACARNYLLLVKELYYIIKKNSIEAVNAELLRRFSK